ncbi:DUF1016 family protein [Aeromonas caviae]|uniref:DUF1016 family protein n=1 Tax=Aeromonas caviae TaxID=648 RepID=UPI0008527784|nr:DUF1016 family protein [Aeromonas caviae]OEG05796.1 hypothetical protein BFG06_20640 [Aeromonas caviae]
MNTTPLIPAGYTDWLAGIKKEIAQARSRAALAVNAELVRLYGRIGQEIVQRQAEQGCRVLISNICVFLLSIAPKANLVSSLLTNYPGFILSLC